MKQVAHIWRGVHGAHSQRPGTLRLSRQRDLQHPTDCMERCWLLTLPASPSALMRAGTRQVRVRGAGLRAGAQPGCLRAALRARGAGAVLHPGARTRCARALTVPELQSSRLQPDLTVCQARMLSPSGMHAVPFGPWCISAWLPVCGERAWLAGPGIALRERGARASSAQARR